VYSIVLALPNAIDLTQDLAVHACMYGGWVLSACSPDFTFAELEEKDPQGAQSSAWESGLPQPTTYGYRIGTTIFVPIPDCLSAAFMTREVHFGITLAADSSHRLHQVDGEVTRCLCPNTTPPPGGWCTPCPSHPCNKSPDVLAIYR
jgi:hypothetical protein